MSEIVDQDLCNFLSKQIGADWQDFGRALFIDNRTLENINHNFPDINVKAFNTIMKSSTVCYHNQNGFDQIKTKHERDELNSNNTLDNISMSSTVLHQQKSNSNEEETKMRKPLEISKFNPTHIPSQQSYPSANGLKENDLTSYYDDDLDVAAKLSNRQNVVESKNYMETYYVFKSGVTGHSVKGNKPKVIYLPFWNLAEVRPAKILSVVLSKICFKEDKASVVICNDMQEVKLVTYAINHIENYKPIVYAPHLRINPPAIDEKMKVAKDVKKSKLNVLVTDSRAMCGLESEIVIAFVKPEEYFLRHVIVDVCARSNSYLILLVLPSKNPASQKSVTIEDVLSNLSEDLVQKIHVKFSSDQKELCIETEQIVSINDQCDEFEALGAEKDFMKFIENECFKIDEKSKLIYGEMTTELFKPKEKRDTWLFNGGMINPFDGTRYMDNEFNDIIVEKFPQDVFTTLADLLTYDWQKFSRCLSMDDSAIENVKKEFETTREQTLQILNQWRKDNTSKKWRDVKEGLLFCNRKDLISECERKLISQHSVYGILPPTKAFFSRDDELNQIHKYVCQTNDSGKSITVLTGMSGIGKTQLARKYAAIHKNYFESAVWVDAAFDKIQVSMTNLCHQLGLSVKDSQGDSFDIEVVSRKIHNYFEREKTLYIFDNVDDESVQNFEKYVANKKNAFTLVTSQWKCWSADVNQVQVHSFSPQDAFLFAKSRIKQILTNDDDKLKEITKVLQYHPLAINQAILYINNNSVSLQEYLDLFQSYTIEPLEQRIDANADSVSETETLSALASINIVLSKIETFNEKSLEILNHLSYCNGQHIAKKFIYGNSKHLQINEEFLINRAIRTLVSYSLLDRFDDNNDKYAMHEMMQLACKCYQERKKVIEVCNENIVNFLKLQLEEVNLHVDDGKHFYNHFIHMFRVNKPKMCEVFHQQSWIIQSFLSNKGFFQEAINILDAIQKYNTKPYGAENQTIFDTKHNIALCLSRMGKYNEALEIYHQVDKIQTDILGINHPATLDTKNNIANCLNKMGKYNEALEIYHQVDKIQTDVLGINHPSTLGTKNNIANCLDGMGKYNESLEIYYQVDKSKTDVLGINHPSTFDTKNSIANCLYGMGKYNEALEVYYQVDKSKTDVLGINHPALLDTKKSIASCLNRIGKYILGINNPSRLNKKCDIMLA